MVLDLTFFPNERNVLHVVIECLLYSQSQVLTPDATLAFAPMFSAPCRCLPSCSCLCPCLNVDHRASVPSSQPCTNGWSVSLELGL